MKMKKAISLVLGGVLALSMLAGCSSSSGEEAGTLVETPTSNTAVVAEVVANMTKSNVGEAQYATTLTGNETADLQTALKEFDAASAMTDRQSLREAVTNALSAPSETTVLIMTKKDGLTDAEIGVTIFNGLADASSATGDTNYRMAKLSVFDAVTTSSTTSSDATTTISGSNVNYTSTSTTEYWVIVITSASNGKTSTDDGSFYY